MDLRLYRTKKEMLEESEADKLTALNESNILKIEIGKMKRKKILVNSTIFIVLFSLFKIFIGEIIIPVSFLRNNHSRFYEIYVNEKLFDIRIEETLKLPIIPLIMYLPAFAENSYHQDPSSMVHSFGTEEEIYIEIKSYKCYEDFHGKNLSRPCTNQLIHANLSKKRINNLPKLKMEIIKMKTGKTVYKGIFKEEVGQFLNEKGYYHISITFEYGMVDGKMETSIKIE